jgi:hypothetical protein
MASHRTRFTLDSHIQFGSLDFLYTRVDHDLVLLPPSMPVDHVIGTEKELIPLPHPGQLTHPLMSTLSLSQWPAFTCMPLRCKLSRVPDPLASTTRG